MTIQKRSMTEKVWKKKRKKSSRGTGARLFSISFPSLVHIVHCYCLETDSHSTFRDESGTDSDSNKVYKSSKEKRKGF